MGQRFIDLSTRKNFALIFALILFYLVNSDAYAEPTRVEPACRSEQIRTLNIPCNYSQAKSNSFLYRFKNILPKIQGAPTVIFLTGGPGESVIREWPHLDFLPSDFGQILIDPRGVGCNNQVDACELHGFYSSEALARDVLEIIKLEKLNNYVIYGVSYGTVVATIATHLIENSDLPRPKAIILEGVLGKHFVRDNLYLGFNWEWQRIKENLSPAALEKINQALPPLGLSPDEWGAFIQTALNFGAVQGSSNFIESRLSVLGSGSEDELKSLKREVISASKVQPRDANFRRLYKPIACTELFPITAETDFDLRLVRGALQLKEGNFCEGQEFSNPWDSAKWQVRSVPIYYLVGGRDPSTPSWQARYHYEHQTSARRYLLFVDQAGHNPFSFNLDRCAPNVIATMLAAPENLPAATKLCDLKIEIESR